jgi:magnesium chelatase subunit D
VKLFRFRARADQAGATRKRKQREKCVDYPFTALVGQDALKRALCLIATNPSIGGVLIRGERGTAKSTAARALAALLPRLQVVSGCPFNCDPDALWADCPHCHSLAERAHIESPAPFVDLPLGATEDRVLGTLDFDRALREGRRSFQPGLLAAAHRGVLYIDEVNLLADHLVDVLLDAAALGVNTVQREGVAVIHPARFLLIGTMNPEEGDLRPQLLDRFGLMVEVTGPREPEVRVEVVRRRLGYEADPDAFARTWEDEQQALRERIRAARSRLVQVSVTDDLVHLISRICCEFAVDGLRADIVMNKTARTLAAFEGRNGVTAEDVRAAAELVLAHRGRRRPFEQPGLDRDQLDKLLTPPRSIPQEHLVMDKVPGQAPAADPQHGAGGEQVFGMKAPGMIRKLEMASSAQPVVAQGRRNPAPAKTQGQYRRAVADEKPAALAVDATIRAAVRRGGFQAGALEVEQCDLHRKERLGKTGACIVFVVDASGSMAARRRMELVKGTVLRLLEDAYQHRDQVGVIAFRGPDARLVLPFTSSMDQAARALRELPTGGRTPLAHALVLAADLIRKAGPPTTDTPVTLILISDGKANVALPGSVGDPWRQSLETAGQLARAGAACLVLDSETGLIRSGRTRELATALAAEYLTLDELTSDDLVLKVRSRFIASCSPNEK